MLPLFAPDAPLPAPLTAYDPTIALPDFAARVEKLRRWQQSIASGYVTTQKEEALQAEFLNLVFGQALGYEHERPDYRQLLLEKKTNVDGTKPDGALGQFAADPKGRLGGPVRAVVELKDARTGLDAKQKLGAKGRAETPVEQAFSYPSKMGASCRWVIVSNFVELRLYAANDQTRAEVFDFRTLPDQPAALRRFFALLAAGQLLPLPAQPDAPLDLALRQRQEQEARISQEFYRDYRTARRALLDHLIDQNPAVPPLALLQHTQKLLDRVIFVCFCEDKNIIPRLTFRRLLDAVRANVFDPADDKIYRTVRGLFQAIDLGNPTAGINRFNGGLFAPDAALDALVIKDRTLKTVIDLEGYDFASELNVNILGHIFEQSLADLEAERARLSGEAPPTAKQGKRKQDGIFYTPDYITRYIVGQAVGGWLRERRREAGLDALPDLSDADRASIRVRPGGGGLAVPTARVQQHLAAWAAYGQRLRAIRVLDPACGSGAFLNEAFGYLFREGRVVNEALAELRAGQYDAFDLDRHILQHNLYGVDLNPESVQISRLSLWLQTANPGRPLTALDHSIRCGNSLIADPAVAGERAFDWHQAFPEVFADGGFDVVVGNPPYVFAREKISEAEKSFYTSSYKSAQYQINTYLLFIEQTIKLLSKSGLYGLIVPNAWLMVSSAKGLRELVLKESSVQEIINLSGFSFENVNVETIIIIAQKHTVPNQQVKVLLSAGFEFNYSHSKEQNAFLSNEGFELNVFSNEEGTRITEKIRNGSVQLQSIADIKAGLKAYQTGKGKPKQTPDIVQSRPFDYTHKFNDDTYQYLEGKDVSRYNISWSGGYLHFGPHLAEPRMFHGEKIIIREIAGKYPRAIIATYADDEYLFNISNIAVVPKRGVEGETSLKYVLALLNSKLMSYYFLLNTAKSVRQMFPKIILEDLRRFPVKQIPPAAQLPFIALADALLTGHRALHAAEADFAALLRAELGLLAPLTGKLAPAQEWKSWSLALQKSLRRALALAEKNEWLRYHQQHGQQQAAQRQHLAALDAELDGLVYALYGLSAAEVALVAGNGAAQAQE